MNQTTIIARRFFKLVNLNYVRSVLENINFSEREKKIVNLMLDRKTIKEMSIELNLSLSYIAFIKQEIYKKIYLYIQEKNKNYE